MCGLIYKIVWLIQMHLTSFNGGKVLLHHAAAQAREAFLEVELLGNWSAQYVTNTRPSLF